MSNHARRRQSEFFSDVDVDESFKLAVNCSKEEVTGLKNSPSFKRLKASDKKARKYLKTPCETIYFVCSEKVSKSGVRNQVIVTLIDLHNENPSFISDSFKKEMIVKSFELEEKSKKPKEKKVIKDNDFSREGVSSIKTLFEGQKRLLTKIKMINDKQFLSKNLKYHAFDTKRYTYTTEMLLKINKVANKVESIYSLIESLKDESLNKNQRRNLKDTLKGTSLSVIKVLKTYHFELDFIDGSDTCKTKKIFYKFFAKIINTVDYALFDVLEKDLEQESKKNRKELEKIIDFFKPYKDLHPEVKNALSNLSIKMIGREKNEVLNLIKKRDSGEMVYSSNLRQLIRNIDDKINLISDPIICKRLNEMKLFVSMMNDKIEQENQLALPLNVILGNVKKTF